MDTGMPGLLRIFHVSPAGVHVGSLSPLGSLTFSLYEVLIKCNVVCLTFPAIFSLSLFSFFALV